MSDPLTTAKINLYNSTSYERDWWNKSSTEAKLKLVENLDFRDIQVSQYEIASEHAYQQEHTAKLNQLLKTNYNALSETVKTFITEALIVEGKLPSPSDYKGIGLEFSINKETCVECDRCDNVFMSKEEFDDHKEFDHGDAAEDEEEEAEDSFQSLMDEDVTKEELQEARKLLSEKEMPDFGRDTIFNGKDLPQATASTPDDVKGKKGYDDNPNEFFYDNKKFKRGSSADRYGGMVSEVYGGEGKGEYLCKDCDFATTDSIGAEKHYDNTGHDIPTMSTEGVSYVCDDCGKAFNDPISGDNHEEEMGHSVTPSTTDYGDYISNENDNDAGDRMRADKSFLDQEEDTDRKYELTRGFPYQQGEEIYDQGLCQTCGKTPVEHENADHTFQHRMAEAVGADGMADPTIIVTPAEGGIDDEYTSAVTLGDIEYVNVPSATDEPIEMLKDVDFSEEKIDYVYPTKATEEYVEDKDPYLEDYGNEDDIESEDEAVEAQIIDRKLRGSNTEAIATELVMQYGCPREQAIEKILSIEVSTNDIISNTFFGKRFHECNEAEIEELKLYSGSDNT